MKLVNILKFVIGIIIGEILLLLIFYFFLMLITYLRTGMWRVGILDV